ncbi:hypothetical protein [Bradyrhizobium sp. WSM1417]|uniref:hypothetical protein n=1 Tax=Bradyrhizobium sp. WSM1417 TaxID=754500 RepID=UPI0004AED4E3|nr:hypothetical protein [Bradyrhizobium sp. WSM1417]
MTEDPSGGPPSESASLAQLGRSLIGLRIVLQSLLRFYFLIWRLRWRSRYFMRLCATCHMACLFEIWPKVSDGGPLDSDSHVYKQAHEAVGYYLMRSSTSRTKFAAFEPRILGWNYLAWHLAQTNPPEAQKHFRFMRKHRLARIIRYYENIQNYINYLAASEIEPLQQLGNEATTREDWKLKVDFDQLPAELKTKPHSARRLSSFLRKKLRSARGAIAIKNYLKVDFTLSDISSFIAISGALLLLLGFGRIALLGWSFGVPFSRYFSTTDYVASGLGEIYGYLGSALLSATLAFLRLATATAVSVQEPEIYQRTWSGRSERWILHSLGISGVVALVVVGLRDHRVDTLSLAIAMYYLLSLTVWNVSVRFFKDPLKAGMLLVIIAASSASTLVGTVREIQAMTEVSLKEPPRTIRFTDATYDEPSWRVFAITNNFVLLRRHSDGVLVVKARTDLKSIEDQTPR